MEEEALSSRLSTSEKLLISQAVYKLGALDWEKISGLLVNHPVIEGRPAEWFDTKTCEAYYVGLMTEAGINVPAQDAARPQAKVHLRLAQKFYFARLQELKSSIAEYEHRFTTLMSEIAAIKSGSMDQGFKDEIRGVLAKKFGKKLLDSWVPDEGAVKEAVEAGPPSEEELASAQVEAIGDKIEPVSEEATKESGASADVPVLEEMPTEETTAGPPETSTVAIDASPQAQEQAEEEELGPAVEKALEDIPTPPVNQDVNMEEGNEEEEEAPPKQLSPVKGRVLTPIPTEEPESSSPVYDQTNHVSSAVSDLSSVPDDEAHLTRSGIKVPETPPKTGRTSKRKASMQPKGAATSKRTRRKMSTPAVAEPEPAVEDSEKVTEEDAAAAAAEADAVAPATEGDVTAVDAVTQEDVAPVEQEAEPATTEAETEEAGTPKGPEPEPEPEPVEEEEPQSKRGRRTSKRESIAAGRSKRGTSPVPSSKHASPQPQPPSSTKKRGTSVSSAKSATPVEDRRTSRRGTRGRGMRDEVVSKSVREQTVESVKEEEGEPQAEVENPQETETEVAEQEVEDQVDQSMEVEQDQEQDQEAEVPSGQQEAEQEQEQERPPTRSSRRVKDTATPNPDPPPTALPDTRKGTRRSSARGGAIQPEAEEEKPDPKPDAGTPKEKKQAKRPRHSSPKESKATQRMLTGLLEQIAGHRNGNVFAQPVKSSDAPGYYEVIKRPMDLKTIRGRIRDGHITTLDEFERDLTLMFANATMFNAKGTTVHDMTMEMMRDSEERINHLRSVQLHIGR